MRRGFEVLLFAGALIAFACSGGPDQGPVVGPGPGPTEPGEGVERGDNPFDLPGTNGSSSAETNSASTTVTTGSGMCSTCRDILDGFVAMEFCPGSAEAVLDLAECACSGNCMNDCASNICSNVALDSTCEACLDVACREALSTCEIN